MKFLFVSPEALSIDLAYRISQEGNEVKFHIQSETEKDVGDGFVDKVDGWENLVDWADVVVFDDIAFGKVADKLRADGKKVVGGSSFTDRLENDREFGQQELAKVGVSILPSWNFSDFDEAIKFVQGNPERYVIKPSGRAQNEKELLFVGQEEDGNDVINVLAHYKKNWSNKIRNFQVQKFASGVEVGVGAFFNGKDFAMPININFEHKRLFPGEIGPSTGEMGCYDDQTEVLTDNGWKLFKDLSYDDSICTLRPLDHIIEFDKPEAIVCYSHHKKLVSIRNNTLDIAVTPDHNMYVCTQENARNGSRRFDFMKARDLQYQSVIKRTGTWIGIEQAYFVLPSVALAHFEGRAVVLHETAEISIPMDNWLAFMGIWLSEGSASSGYKVSISQKKPEKTKRIQELLDRLPFRFSEGRSEFYCFSKQLHSYLVSFGKAYQKSIPQFIKELSPRQIGIFLDWFALGDGTMMKNGFRIFYTSSRKLADDIQELLLKVSRVGTVKTRERYGRIWIKDHFATATRPQYEVIERVRKLDSWLDRRDIRIVDYDGKVYCATVKNHIMYVRRNGKPYWCGNTSMLWSQKSKIFELTLGRMKERLVESGYVGYIDINCIANTKSIYPLEFTSRFGYPTISIQMEGVTSEWGKFLSSLAGGNGNELRTKKGFQVGVVVALPPFPFNDERTFKKYSEDAAILFKKQNNTDGVHLGEVKRSENDWRVAGRSGYCLIVTGSGHTMEDARNQAYNRVSNIMIPNMFYRTDIGRRWTRDSDLLQSSGFM
ncbi:MAG: phosphoribosylglycinamide synthetase C domain-containing protein [Nitrososphaera sp.]